MDTKTICDWIASTRRSTLDDGAALEAWHLFTPRCRFIKTLPNDASVLDVGAGDGSLQVYRHWPAPQRNDLAMYAFAMSQGEQFHRYAGWELGAWPGDKPDFKGKAFDAILAANFIEHIDDPFDFLRWAARRLTPDGSLYLEWPGDASLDLPTAAELRTLGVDVMAGNYFDDATHRPVLPQVHAIVTFLQQAGLRIDEVGTIRLPFLHDHLMAMGNAADDTVLRTLAYWSFTGWCQYMIARRDRAPASLSGP